MDFWDASILSLVNDYDNLIIMRTASKAVGAAAIRLGFAVTNKVNSNALKAVKSPYNVNTVSQKSVQLFTIIKTFYKKDETLL